MRGMDPGYCIDVPPGFDDSDEDALAAAGAA
jgi:hypothetical protein